MRSDNLAQFMLNIGTTTFWGGIAAALVLGCSGASTSNCGVGSTTCGTGGLETATGGAATAGGSSAQGGISSTGGLTSSGGSVAQGGSSNTGGSNAVASNSGGNNTGGAITTGGSNGATGGLTSTAGKSATGGMSSTVGGSTGTGGKSATGGTSSTGGKSATGGTSSTGGKSATGGNGSTGGAAPATGGTVAAGGGTGTSATCTGTHTNPLSQTVIDQFVAAHNAARSGPLNPTPNPPLPPVSWDCILADSAYNYLSQCPGGNVSLAPHNANRTTDYAALGGTGYVGENIYASTGSTVTPQAAVNSWMSEASAYDYTTNNITAAGHYTQVVWRASIRIGCAIVNCPNYTFNNTILCDYSPGGNITSQKPY